MAVEHIGNCVRRIVRIKVPFCYVRLCFGHDSTGLDKASRFTNFYNWHLRLTSKVYICMGWY